MKVLLFEINPFHHEVLPGFAYYLIRLGFEVDCLMQKNDVLGDPFSKCPLLKEKIHFHYFQKGEEIKVFEELQRQHVYDLLLANSFHYYKNGDWESIMRMLPSLDKNRLGVVGYCHDLDRFLENRIDDLIPVERVIALSKTNIGGIIFPEVNANYLCDYPQKKPKNQTIRILSVGRSTDRRALWNAAEAARKRIKQPVHFVCVGRKRPAAARIVLYSLYAVEKLSHVRIRYTVRNLPPLFAKLFRKQELREIFNPPFQDLFKEVEDSDFLDGSILSELKPQFSSYRTSGVKQLSLGFLKPCIIEKRMADFYGFTDRNAVIYEEGKMDEAIIRAASMTEKEYSEMVSELEKLCKEIRDRSESNLRNIISKLEAVE